MEKAGTEDRVSYVLIQNGISSIYEYYTANCNSRKFSELRVSTDRLDLVNMMNFND